VHLQPSFYVAIGTFTAAFVLYRITKSTRESGSESWISDLISKWTPSEKVFEERNAIRTAAMEKAAVDRHLFRSAPGKEYIALKDPEYVAPSTFWTGKKEMGFMVIF
jgi:hypothetical protein